MQHLNLAKAAESIERQALEDLFRFAPERTRSALGMEQAEEGGATLFLARDEPSILLNRVLGLGVDRPTRQDEVERIRDRYAEAGIAEYFLHVQPWARPAELWSWLFEAGLARDRGWTQFSRGPGPAASRLSALRIERIGMEHAVDFARIAASGFGLSESVLPALEALVGLPDWHHFMSFKGDTPAGVAALRVAGDIGWLDWAATDVEFRGQGSQTALLAARIRTAVDLGCRLLFSETGEAVPGDPQHSFKNLVRAGFVPTHTRENFAPCRLPSEIGRIQATAG